jgi:serine/threonine-protein kinase
MANDPEESGVNSIPVEEDATVDFQGQSAVPKSDWNEAKTKILGRGSAGGIVSSSSESTKQNLFGDYEILSEIARGGMGVVFKARQLKLDRIVALKMILSGELATEETVSRFYTEAKAAATLDHPGIVPVYEIGENDGKHFFAMGYVEGKSLAEQIRIAPMTIREAAMLMCKIAQAVSYAHERGIIHRDLKPANILLDTKGEPRVSDFGLARNVNQDNGVTKTGDVMGTPSYMPPEQALGETSNIGVRSDVYSLGAILYHLVTGRPPYQAATPLETLLQVVEQDPLNVRQLNKAVDPELSAICMKCLEKEPIDRYESAGKLADDLQRYLNGEQISIRATKSVQDILRRLDRHRDDRDIRTWGQVLVVFAPVVLLSELLINWIVLRSTSTQTAFFMCGLVRAMQFLAMGGTIWVLRGRLLATRRSVSEQMWSLWIGFILACNLSFVVLILQAYMLPSPNRNPLVECYPFFSLLSGLLWFAMGSNFWGFCFIFGLFFFLNALLDALFPSFAPSMF